MMMGEGVGSGDFVYITLALGAAVVNKQTRYSVRSHQNSKCTMLSNDLAHLKVILVFLR